MSNNKMRKEEREQIEKLIKYNLSLREIARRIGRAQGSICNEVRRCGGKYNYNAEEAQRIYEDNVKRKNEHLRQMNKGKKKVNRQDHANRLTNLEMQVEILAETIKELMNESKRNKKL